MNQLTDIYMSLSLLSLTLEKLVSTKFRKNNEPIIQYKYIKNKLDKTLGVKPIIHQSELRTYTKVVVPFVLLYCDKY